MRQFRLVIIFVRLGIAGLALIPALTLAPLGFQGRAADADYATNLRIALTLSAFVGVPLAAAIGLHFWKPRQHRPGRCNRCGYDLRGSPPAGPRTCPECGEPDRPHDDREA